MRLAVCGRSAVIDDSVAARGGAAAGKAMDRQGKTTAPVATGPESSTGLGEATGHDAALLGMAQGELASRHAAETGIALRRRPHSARASRRLASGAVSGTMAAHGMAENRKGANQVLAFDAAGPDQAESAGEDGQAPLDH